MRHPKTEVLSELLDGELTPTQARKVQEHLEACGQCAALFRDLKEIQARARSLPDQTPPRDLWPAISRAMGRGGDREAEVIHLHPEYSPQVREVRKKGLRMSYLQAAAAALALAFFSGLAGARFARPVSDTEMAATSSQPAWVAVAGQGDRELTQAAEEINNLEALLARHRNELEPATIRILEKNLDIIDQAIRESVQALEEDPGNPFLRRHLAQAVETKATYLREATAFMAPAS